MWKKYEKIIRIVIITAIVYIGLRYFLPLLFPFVAAFFVAWLIRLPVLFLKKMFHIKAAVGSALLLLLMIGLTGTALFYGAGALVKQVVMFAGKCDFYQQQVDMVVGQACCYCDDFFGMARGSTVRLLGDGWLKLQFFLEQEFMPALTKNSIKAALSVTEIVAETIVFFVATILFSVDMVSQESIEKSGKKKEQKKETKKEVNEVNVKGGKCNEDKINNTDVESGKNNKDEENKCIGRNKADMEKETSNDDEKNRSAERNKADMEREKNILNERNEENYGEEIQDENVIWKEWKQIKHELSGAGIAYLKTQMILTLLVSITCITGFFIIRNPYALLFGIAVGLFDAFPVLGSGLILVPYAIVEFFKGRYFNGAMLLTMYGGCQFIREYLEPKLLGGKIGLRPIYTLMAVYVGYELFGIFGIFLGPIGFVLIRALVRGTEPKEETKADK